MHIHVVDLLEDVNHSANEEAKMSSSNKRMRLLGTLLQEPQVRESHFSISSFFLFFFCFFFQLFIQLKFLILLFIQYFLFFKLFIQII